MEKQKDRRLETPEDMLALAEELASRSAKAARRSAAGKSRLAQTRRKLIFSRWSGWLLGFLAGAGFASLLWWSFLI